MLGVDLLSHGETPHYHRRCCVSLLSSGWDQVVPQLYGHQANWQGWEDFLSSQPNLEKYQGYLITEVWQCVTEVTPT